MKRIKKILCVVMMAILVVGFFPVSSLAEDIDYSYKGYSSDFTGIELNKYMFDSDKLKTGFSWSLYIDYYVNGEYQSNPNFDNVAWESENPYIATVECRSDGVGIVEGVSAGTTTVTATVTIDGETYSDDYEVIVVKDSSSSKSQINLKVGEVYFWEPTYPNNDREDWFFSATSSDYSVASVISNNKFDELKSSVRIEARQNGVATITVKSFKTNTIKTCTVTVGNATPTPTPIVDPDSEISVRGVSISPNSKTICVGDKFDIHATVTPDNATNKKIIWDSSLPSIATVDENGTVTGIATGYTTIFAETEDGGFFDMCDVVVKDTSPDPTPTPDPTPDPTPTPTPTPSSDTLPVYRFYNPNNGDHVYTTNENDKVILISWGWGYEGVAFYDVGVDNGVPVYRSYNPNTGEHIYTAKEADYNALPGMGWVNESIAFYAKSSGDTPVYRFFNPNAITGTHLYTSNMDDVTKLTEWGWIYEGICWYAY